MPITLDTVPPNVTLTGTLVGAVELLAPGHSGDFDRDDFSADFDIGDMMPIPGGILTLNLSGVPANIVLTEE